MNIQHFPGSRVAIAASIVAGLMLYDPAHAESASAGACAPPAKTLVARRVHEEAAQGVESLRRFVVRTRMIYALDLPTEIAKLDGESAATAACEARAAATVDHGSVASR